MPNQWEFVRSKLERLLQWLANFEILHQGDNKKLLQMFGDFISDPLAEKKTFLWIQTDLVPCRDLKQYTFSLMAKFNINAGQFKQTDIDRFTQYLQCFRECFENSISAK